MPTLSTQAEWDRYMATGGAQFINSDEFKTRWETLQARLPAEPMTVADCAAFVGLPLNIFRHYLAHIQAAEFFEMGEPPSGSVN